MGKQWRWILFCAFIVFTTLLLVQFGNKVTTVLAERRIAEREHCIVIDPGHGGEDGGAVSVSGFPESEFNLEIALRLQDLIQLLGYDTKMIRTKDVSVYIKGESLAQKKVSDLKERVRITNETDGGILLSVHQNHFPDPQLRGAQVFYAQTKDSEVLAKQIQDLIACSVNPGNRRQIKKLEGVYLMEHIQVPGVLIECGFLSNPQEERSLRDPEYQKKLSTVIAVAVSRFLSNT